MIMAAASGAEMFSGPPAQRPHLIMVTDPTFIHGSQILENACLKAIKGCLKAVSCCWMTDALHRTYDAVC